MPSGPVPAPPLRVVTYNVRFDNPDDPFRWHERRAGIADLLNNLIPDVFGLQEVLGHQLTDLTAALPGYAYIGVGRGPRAAEGKPYAPTSGEYNPVFYRTERFDLLDGGTFWLSSTPAVPGSQLPWVSHPRIVTWTKLNDKQASSALVFANTHFPFEEDEGGARARALCAEVLLRQLGRIAGDLPVVIAGDFNFSADDPTDRLQAYALLRSRFDDAFDAPVPHRGPEATYVGFAVGGSDARRIDYVFTSRQPGVTVRRYETVAAHRGPYYFSDHLPVVVEVSL